MSKFSAVLLVLLTVFISINSVQARTPSSTVQEKVAELGFRIGPETQSIPGGGITERTWVDKRNIIVPGADSRSYLIRFRQSCQGTLSKRMVPRLTKQPGQISQYDKYITMHETRSLASCEIRYIYTLEPIE